MARLKDFITSFTASNNNSHQIQLANSINKQARESGILRIEPSTVAEERFRFPRRFFQNFFYVHLILIAILTIALITRGLISWGHGYHFHPEKWYPPLLAATGCGAIFGLTWQWITSYSPSKAMRAVFYFTPIITCSTGILLVLIGSKVSLAVGVIAVVSSIIIAIYNCWITPRLEYAIKILSVSIAFPPAKTPAFVFLSMAVTVLYSGFLVVGIGGATSTGKNFDSVFTAVIFVSLSWTLQVIKNTISVTISRIRYINFASGMEMEIQTAYRETIKYLMGSITMGSALVPYIVVVRGSARIIKLVAGGTDEFLFSCANCYSAVASNLIGFGNRWGFVQVGIYDKGFVQASRDTWALFRMSGMEPLIDSDLTGSFCFFSGLIGGALSSFAGGTWALVIHKSYATEISLYAFVIGYFICRVAMAWPQACVSAYYVAYAEHPLSPGFDSTIPSRIQQIQRSMA